MVFPAPAPAIHVAYISEYLTRWERRETVAYIPCQRRNFTGHNDFSECGRVLGVSGVTVASGLDLGQQSMADLDRMDMPDELTALFVPYLCLRGDAAVAALARAPLTLTEEQCAAVDAAVHTDYIRRAAAAYDNEQTAMPFAKCPPQAQAVIVSLFYHVGYGKKQYPYTWACLLCADWQGAAYELETGFTRYVSRRADEARLLREIGA